MTVLVLDGELRSCLSIVRSLGRHGVDVHVGAQYSKSVSTYSKYCSGEVVYEDPTNCRRSFIDDLKSIVKDTVYEMVIGAGEATTYSLAYHKKELEPFVTVPFPGWDTMETVADKKLTFDHANRINIPTPETYSPADRDATAELSSELSYPVVIKPRSKTTWVDDTPVKIKVTDENYVQNTDELLSVYDRIVDKIDTPPLIQEYIPGEGYGVELLRYDGDIQTVFMHKRLREYPITGGASTYRKSIYDETLLEPAVALLEQLDWEGVAMVELRVDDRDGRPKLLEVNGRFWGSLPLAVAAGADFPYDLYTAANKGQPQVSNYQTDVYSRWLFPGDLLWLVASLRNNPTDASTVAEFIKSTPSTYDILSSDDPYPILGIGKKLFRQAHQVYRGEKVLTGEDR